MVGDCFVPLEALKAKRKRKESGLKSRFFYIQQSFPIYLGKYQKLVILGLGVYPGGNIYDTFPGNCATIVPSSIRAQLPTLAKYISLGMWGELFRSPLGKSAELKIVKHVPKVRKKLDEKKENLVEEARGIIPHS